MKNKNNTNSEQNLRRLHGGNKQQFDELWLELEPRLKKPKRNRWFFLFCFLAISIAIGFIGFTSLNIGEGTSAERTTTERTENQKERIIQQEKHSVITEDQKNNTEAIPNEINHENSNLETNNSKASLSTKPSAISKRSLDDLGSITNSIETHPAAVMPSNTSISTTSKVASNTELNTTKRMIPVAINTEIVTAKMSIADTLPKQVKKARGWQINTKGKLALVPLKSIQPLPLPKQHILAQKMSLKVISSPKRLKKVERQSIFGLTISSIILFNQKSELEQNSIYHNQIEDHLTMDQGYQFAIVPHINIASNFELGLGMNYTEMFETFRLQNEVQTEQLISHPEAFSSNGDFIAAEKHLPVTVSQNIQHNNSYVSLSLVPQMHYNIEFKKSKISFGAALPILVMQDYKGTLFDQQQLIIKEGEIFEERRFKRYGLQLHHSFSVPITEAIDIAYLLTYQKWNGQNSTTSGYSQDAIQSIGIGLQLGY